MLSVWKWMWSWLPYSPPHKALPPTRPNRPHICHDSLQSHYTSHLCTMLVHSASEFGGSWFYMYIPTIFPPWSIESVTICQSGRSSLRAMCNKLYLTLHKTTPTVGLSTCLGVMPELRLFRTSETWCVRHETRINKSLETTPAPE